MFPLQVAPGIRFTNGVNQYVQVVASSILNNLDFPTVLMWASVTTLVPAAQRNFFGKSGGNNNWVGYMNSAGLNAQYGRATQSALVGAATSSYANLAVNQPTFFVFQNDINTTANNRLMVGGGAFPAAEPSSYLAGSPRAGSGAHDDSASQLAIGNASSGGTSNTLPGTIYTIQVFKTILNFQDIHDLQFKWDPRACGCILAMRLGANGLGVVLDESGFGHHSATIVGSPEQGLTWLPYNVRRTDLTKWKKALFPGTAYSLSAAAGTFTLSGTTAALKVGHRINATSGSYVLTGTAASLQHGSRVIANGGSIVLNGTAAALLLNHRLSAVTGSFTWSGVAAALVLARQLSAQSGVVTVSGTDATLLGPGNRLTAAAGSFSLTGAAASLTIGRRVSALSGTITWTGTATNLLQSHRLSATSGVVSWTGIAALLTQAKLLSASSGSVVISGSNAALLLSHILGCTPGSVSFTGQTALLTWSAEAHVKIYLEGEVVLSIGVAGEFQPTINVAGDTGYLN